MKKYFLCLTIYAFSFAACNNNAADSTMENDTANSTASSVKTTSENEFPTVEFASKKDLACGMPLSAGVHDTAHYEGEVYGFCSKECKDEFITKPAYYIAQKK